MTLVVNIVLLALCAIYLWHLWAAALGRGSSAEQDRLRLVTLVLEVALMLFLVRVLVTWSPATSWVWVAAVAAAGGGTALALRRAPSLPWFTARTPRRLRVRRVQAPLYAVLLAALNGVAWATLL